MCVYSMLPIVFMRYQMLYNDVSFSASAVLGPIATLSLFLGPIATFLHFFIGRANLLCSQKASSKKLFITKTEVPCFPGSYRAVIQHSRSVALPVYYTLEGRCGQQMLEISDTSFQFRNNPSWFMFKLSHVKQEI